MKLNLEPNNRSLLARRRNDLLSRPTPAELHVKALLKAMDERFIFQKGFFTQIRFFIVDFYLPKRRKLCLEIDGKYHARQEHYDAHRDAFLAANRGFRVLRIANEDALALDAKSILNLIK